MTAEHIEDRFDGVEVETAPDAEFAIIWLHGLGADSGDFVSIVPELRLPRSTRFIFPNAPVRPVTINGGYRMRAWFDILSFDRNADQDVAGIEASAARVRELAARERERGIAPENILLAGFSQGGAIALHTALTGSENFLGVLALSTYLPLADASLAANRRINTAIPVWMAHGLHDPVIDLATATRSRDQMVAAGVEVEWHAYQMPHSLCPEEVANMAAWLSVRQTVPAA